MAQTAKESVVTTQDSDTMADFEPTTRPRSTTSRASEDTDFVQMTQPVPFDLGADTRTPLLWSLTRRLGGPVGKHVAGISRGWVYIVATISWLLCMVRQVPCVRGTSDTFGWMCYSDITALYSTRGQNIGGIPYAGVQWEYPVLTGYFVTIANWISKIFGAVLSPDATGDQLSTNTHIYFAVNAVLLFACLIWLVTSVMKLASNMPQLAMLVAISPGIWTTGLINWDLFVVALTAAGFVAWKEEKWVMSGVWWGLAVAAKFYPIVIIGALLILCIRPDSFRQLSKLRGWGIMTGIAAAIWAVVNLPVMLTHFDGWEYFFTFNEQRGADLGSFWYALSLMGVSVNNPATWALWSRSVMILGYLGLALLIYLAKRPPTAIQIAYLAVAIMLVGNLVYSPQYVLWILPLVVLARPRAVDFWVFTMSELFYFVLIWLYLKGNDLSLGFPSAPWMYIFSIVTRIAATVFVMTRVARDMIRA